MMVNDNGTELTSIAIVRWSDAKLAIGRQAVRGMARHSSWQANPDAFVESFKGKLRDECLNEKLFTALAHAWVKLAEWQPDYNSDETGMAGRHSRARRQAAFEASWMHPRRDRKTSSAGACPGTACRPFNHQPNNERIRILNGNNQPWAPVF